MEEMALWNIVHTDFDAEDETINFGSRIVVENKGLLYESSTIAWFQPDKKVDTNPFVSACVQYGCLCVVIGKSITLFEDETCTNIIMNVSFELSITSHCVSQDKLFLFVGLVNGILHCFHIPSEGKPVFSINIPLNGGGNAEALKFIHQEINGNISNIYLVSASGHVYSLSDFHAQEIHTAFINENCDAARQMVKDIQCSELLNEGRDEEVISVAVGTLHGQVSFIIGGKCMTMWSSKRYVTLNSFLCNYVKIQFFESYSSLICLHADGSLHVVCPITLLVKRIFKGGPVYDFITIQDKTIDSFQLLILTVSEDLAMSKLCLYSFPDFESKFEVPVSRKTYLVNLIGCSTDDIIFLEGTCNDAQQVETIRIKTIGASLPEDRLGRLIRRGKYDEAEVFAKKFNLNMDVIYRLKATSLLNQLNPWSTNNESHKLDIIISTLDKIVDVTFIFECCNNVLCSDYEQTRKLLLYARDRLTHHLQISESEECSNYLFRISETLRTLETFRIIQSIKTNAPPHDEEELEAWITFSKANLFNECIKYLTVGHLEIAALIWMRHFSTIMTGLTVNSIESILKAIPNTVSPVHLQTWLHHFIPSALSMFPQALSEIILWAYKKIKLFEKSHCTSWPQIGLQFTNDVLRLLTFEESRSFIHWQQEYTKKNSPFQRLTSLIQSLDDIQYLKTNYRITISLDMCLREPLDVVHFLLDKVHTEQISHLADTFLKQYMLNHSLQNDYVFCSYVQRVLSNTRNWWFWEEAPWEKRVAVMIPLIQNIQSQLQQTLSALQKAPVPWSSTMSSLAERSYSFDHELVIQIRAESTYVSTKLILKKYGYERIGLNLKERLINYIIKQNRAEVISDIREITRTDRILRMQALSSHVSHILNIGDVTAAVNLINSFEDEAAVYCCTQIIYNLLSRLSFKNFDASVIHYMEALGSIQTKLATIPSPTNFHDEIIVTDIKTIYCLRERFSITTTPEKYYTEGKEKILSTWVRRTCNFVGRDSEMSDFCKTLDRLADVLRISRFLAASMFFEEYRSPEILQCVSFPLIGSHIVSRNDCLYLNQLCAMAFFSHHCVESPDNPDAYRDLSRILRLLFTSAIISCPDGFLNEISSLASWINVYTEIFFARECSEWEWDGTLPSLGMNKIFCNTYSDAGIPNNDALRHYFKSSLLFFIFHAGNQALVGRMAMTQDNIDRFRDEQFKIARKLQTEQCDNAVLNIIKSLYFNICHSSALSDTLVEMESNLERSIITLLRKIICARSFDIKLGTACLFMLPEQDATKWLLDANKVFRNDCGRHRNVSVLGYVYFRLINNKIQEGLFHHYSVLHIWAKRLSDCDEISYKEVINSSTQNKQNILERVMNSKREGIIQLLQQFCMDFQFDLNECLVLYLHVLLTKWSPTFKLENTADGKELRIDQTEVEELREKCKRTAARIENTTVMKRHLAMLSSQVNFYHYEVFVIIFDLIEEADQKMINYLRFLQNYTRVGKPTQMELDEWAQLNSENGLLPSISEWRFPYLLKIDQWKLITQELNLKTYRKWLTIGEVLGLSTDVICSLSIKNSTEHAWNDSEIKRNATEWSLHTKNCTLLNDIKTCIQHMTGPKALYYAIAALYHVVNNTPQGADQVAAIQECYELANKWVSQGHTLDQLQKIKYKYLSYTAQHILHQNNLGEDRYLKLVGHPPKMIRELYSDESIPLRSREPVQRRPDINTAARELTKLFSLNFTSIKYELLQEWLRPDAYENNMYDSMTETLLLQPTAEDCCTAIDDKLLRACYILQDTRIEEETEQFAKVLINIGFAEDEENNNGPGMRFRALQVLALITNSDTLERLTKRDVTDVRERMKILQYLTELEALGLEYTINSFENSSKSDLVHVLFRMHSRLPRALVLIMQLCLDFKIYDYALWNKTLSEMVNLIMIKDLKYVLPKLVPFSNIVNSHGYVSGWQTVIAEPFRRTDARPTSEQVEHCLQSITLLHACPVVSKLQFTEMVECCFHSRLEHLAAALLPFLNERDKAEVSKRIRDMPDASRVTDNLKSLSLRGLLAASYSLLVLNEARDAPL
ncbi:kinetochore-associated protein 1 [Orussus abietinus]|uniref:kinetochore-associated protein 1 n=1 Tax=Orussus abietinus TaxID=222816 RepID=UPI000626C157|nr:kinetochore-associated protein 1 [Orussus abietinus]